MQYHVFVVMAVAADGLVQLGAWISADTVMANFRFRTCSEILLRSLTGDVLVTCVIIGLKLK